MTGDRYTVKRLTIATTLAALAGLTPWAVTQAQANDQADTQPQVQQVTVVDRTHGTWRGVAQAATSWDGSPHVDVTMASHCDPSTYCVVITSPESYDRDWLGYWQPVAQHVSLVQLNTQHQASRNGRAQQWVVCHEVGHALGVGEVYAGQAGCMVDDHQARDLPTRATARDMRMLDAVATSKALDGSALAYHARQTR